MGNRRQGLMLPEDPGEEELARDWTLSEADRTEVLRCRGDDNRRRFAIQLCVLRQYGTFLDSYASVPVRILNHLNRQLGLQPILRCGNQIGTPPKAGTSSASASTSISAPSTRTHDGCSKSTCVHGWLRVHGRKIFSIRLWMHCASGESCRQRPQRWSGSRHPWQRPAARKCLPVSRHASTTPRGARWSRCWRWLRASGGPLCFASKSIRRKRALPRCWTTLSGIRHWLCQVWPQSTCPASRLPQSSTLRSWPAATMRRR